MSRFDFLHALVKQLDSEARPQSNDKNAPVTVAELDKAISQIVYTFDMLICELEKK